MISERTEGILDDTGTILVVEDTPSAQELMTATLEPLGYTVHVATRGDQALELLDQVRPDVIILDVMMPGMDGFEVCQRIRALPRWHTVPIIMVTALTHREAKLQGLAVGADDFLTKPIDPAEVQARVRTTVALNRARRQLRERERFEWVVFHSRDGYLWTDPEGRLLGANPTARTWLELDASHLAGTTLWWEQVASSFTVVPPTDWATLRDRAAPFELTLVRPAQGQTIGFWLQVQGAPLPNEGGWMMALRDVTDRQAATGQMVTLVHLIAHKFRTPLTIVKGLLELWQLDGFDIQDPEWPQLWQDLMANLTLMEEEIRHATDLVHQWQQPLPGRKEATTVDALQELLFRSADAFLLPRSQIHFESRVAGHTRLPLHQEAWEICLYHLMDNALKFHPDRQPRIRVTVDRVDGGEGVGLRIAFEDDGPGIPPEQRDAVWQPLYQIDPDRAGQVPGLGIGLSLVANVVWGVGGSYHVEEGEMGGTRIVLTLPCSAPAE